jgi:Ca2+-binding RTX toxin-like protein
VIDAAGQGTDSLYSSLNAYTLCANVENLVFTGAGNFTGNGNALANVLTGGAGNDRLDAAAGNDTLNGGVGNDTLIGGSGADTLVGGAGDDLYSVDNAGDVVIEGVNQGTDAVQTTLNAYTLNGNVENLFFVGAGNFAGTGNGVDNILFGGAGNDRLDGGAGNDRLDGGAGDDNLIGGLGNDSLVGGAGNDRLEGGAGNDIMNGGAGNDVFVFAARGFGNDIIQPGFDANPAGGQDLLDISGLGVRASTFNANVHVAASGPNTLITLGTDSVLLQNVSPAEISQNDFLLAP